MSIAITDGHSVADELMKLLIVLQQRSREVVPAELAQGVVDGCERELRIQTHQCGSQVALEHHVPRMSPAKCAIRPKRLLVPGVDALPSELGFEVLGNRGLNQPVFAVDVCVGHSTSSGDGPGLLGQLEQPLMPGLDRLDRPLRLITYLFG